ncbi:shikimate dehydrogenase [Escherichia coli]|uniref:acetyltransferase n=1 Tax=Escherichia coli TaxID=562 RepID=UPI000BE2EA2C|nr:acetyltransferase [Escherichia coli]PDO29947.1 shikimate dehydrogenase [Escherichia coli]
MKKLVILGAGGFSKSIIDSIDHDLYEIAGFIDIYKTGNHQGYPILANSLQELSQKNKYHYFIGIGEPAVRYYFYNLLKKYELKLVNIIDKSALVSRDVVLGSGIYIGKMSIVNPDTKIADCAVINTRSLIEHGNCVGCCSNISTNVVLNGDVKVDELTFIGSSSVINGQLLIGKNSIIGSGSVVIRNVPDNVVVVGAPAKIIKERK